MRAAGIGDPIDQIEAVADAARFALALEFGVRLFQANLVRHFGRHVGFTVDTFNGNVGIQFEWPPDDNGLELRARRDR